MVPIPYGTNESSYKNGFSSAVGVYQCYVHTPPNEELVLILARAHYCDSDGNAIGQITNATAWTDGYYQGFIHWCKSDVDGCVSILSADSGSRGMVGFGITQSGQ